jgi:hypothetical protein
LRSIFLIKHPVTLLEDNTDGCVSNLSQRFSPLFAKKKIAESQLELTKTCQLFFFFVTFYAI